MANDYKAYKNDPDVGLYIYDEEKLLDQLPDGPIHSLDQNIQWISFLFNRYVLIVEADTKSGPYHLVIYDAEKRKYFDIDQEATLFKISEDRKKIIWKSSNYMFLNFEEDQPKQKKIKIDNGKIKHLGILQNGNIGFLAIDKSSMVWIEIDSSSMKAVKTIQQSIKNSVLENILIHENGYITVSTKTQKQDDNGYKLGYGFI
ncbi:MAG: hypothetical protein R3A45_12110 [Bdellovibrionota bacterium]